MNIPRLVARDLSRDLRAAALAPQKSDMGPRADVAGVDRHGFARSAVQQMPTAVDGRFRGTGMRGIWTDGGAAFPTQPVGVDMCDGAEGMSLRDYFAAQALTGAFRGGDADIDDDLFARRCYEIADAMLVARRGGPR